MTKSLFLALTVVLLIIATATQFACKPAAEFEVTTIDIAPPETTAGEKATITVDVKNIGGYEGTYTAILTIDGVEVEKRAITIPPGATEIVTFSMIKEQAGTYQLAVGNLSSSLTVKEKPDTLLEQLRIEYPELFQELLKLPDLREVSEKGKEAIEDIAHLALFSKEPEVKEVLQLMLRGGTPNPKDFGYSVPNYNTELQVLYWLAEQNEFKEDDTLALAIAMTHGLWVTMGDDEVKKTVYRDANDLLNFFRETNEMQKARGNYQLEKYPWEAKVYLSWRGNDLGRGGHVHYQLMSGGQRSPSAVNIHIFYENKTKRISLGDYLWNNVDINTLIEIREHVDNEGLLSKNVDMFVSNTESYFRGYLFTEPKDDWLTYKGEKTVNHNMNNANLEFEYLLENGEAIGVCDDEMTIVDAFLKSWGIPSGSMTRTYGTKDGSNHTHVFYYEPASMAWKSYERQLNIGLEPKSNVYVFMPLVIQRNYYIYHQDNLQSYMKMLNLYHKILGVPGNEVKELFMKGIPTSEVKQWILQD